MTQPDLSPTGAILKTTAVHTVTYFIMGALAYTIYDYEQLFSETPLNRMMRPTDDPLVMAGVLFQPIRGVLFGFVFWLLREPLFNRPNGWLPMWAMLAVVGIFGTFGPSPGSIEGMIYTLFPMWIHIKFLPETILQSLLLSLVLFYWVNHPEKRWIAWTVWILFAVVTVLPVLGLLAA